MSSVHAAIAHAVKVPTGISGFDEITSGGLPYGRTTLVVGGPGSGKTIFALQFLVNGVTAHKEPGIFVAFEETGERIVANANGFGWDFGKLRKGKIAFIDAQPMPDLIQSGVFDLDGLHAGLDAKIKAMGARRIVFDALDMVLALLPDAAARRREIYRLHHWLTARQITAVITLKQGMDMDLGGEQPYGLMQFMVDCAVMLDHKVVNGVSLRNLRVQKFRGSSFDENESPFLIGRKGIEVALALAPTRRGAKVTSERVSSGIERLDTMLGGGYYRGASVLITGSPGTAKTTLSGAFAEAACRRGERTLYVSFDSDCTEVVRDLTSVGIRLGPYMKSGVLSMISARTIAGSAETYLVSIKSLATDHRARCIVIDPVSTWSRSGTDETPRSVAERLTDWSKAAGITLVCTRLLDKSQTPTDGAPLHISTLADTWIHLNYLVQAGERNRGLSIIKSRGTAHSNQVRELILSDHGVTLTDAYTSGGEVLMGTLRWQKERADRTATEVNMVATRLKRVRLDAEEAELEVRLKSLQVEIAAKLAEKALMARASQSHEGELSRGRTRMRELRGADAAPQVEKASRK